MNPDLARALALFGTAVRYLLVAVLRVIEIVAGLLSRTLVR